MATNLILPKTVPLPKFGFACDCVSCRKGCSLSYPPHMLRWVDFKFKTFSLRSRWCNTETCLDGLYEMVPPGLDEALRGKIRDSQSLDDYMKNGSPGILKPLPMEFYSCAIDGCAEEQTFRARDLFYQQKVTGNALDERDEGWYCDGHLSEIPQASRWGYRLHLAAHLQAEGLRNPLLTRVAERCLATGRAPAN